MARRGGVQHVGLERCVERHATHRDAVCRVAANGAVRQDIHVEFGVLAYLELGRIFQQRLQGQQYGVTIQLLRARPCRSGSAGCTLLQMGLHSEGNPDQLRLLGVDPGGFSVESEQLRVV